MYRIAEKPKKGTQIEFPMSILEMGTRAETLEAHSCPYHGCKGRLKWVPAGREGMGLVCERHGFVWKGRFEGD